MLRGYRSQYVALGKALPPNAKGDAALPPPVAGLRPARFLDWLPFQDQIDYKKFKTPRDLYDRLRAWEYDLAWMSPREAPSLQEEILWNVFAKSLGGAAVRRVLHWRRCPPRPPAEPPYQVLIRRNAAKPDGLYPIEALSSSSHLPPTLRFQAKPNKVGWAPSLLDEAKVVLLGSSNALDAAANERLNREFRPIPAAPAAVSPSSSVGEARCLQ